MAHRFYVPDFPSGGTLDLSASEARHAVTVLRLGAGDPLELFDGKGGCATARVVAVERRSVRCEILSSSVDDAGRAVPLTLCVALPKGDRSRWMVEKATELGVSRLVPLRSERSVVLPKQSTLERLERAIIEACKQCGRNRLMEIAEPCTLRDLLEGRSPTAPGPASVCWIAQPGAETAGNTDGPSDQWVAVGPEGGFSDEELAAAQRAGWQPLGLGPHILRIETAALAAAAILGNCRQGIVEP